MDKVCKNCKHFRQVSVLSVGYVWGDCLKLRNKYNSEGKAITGAFTWADKSCDDFELRKTLANMPNQDSL